MANEPKSCPWCEAAEEMYAALTKVLPYMEEAEKAGLIGDEGCHWPVELVRVALAEAVRL